MLSTVFHSTQKPTKVFLLICQLSVAILFFGGSGCHSSKPVDNPTTTTTPPKEEKPLFAVDFIHNTALMPILDQAAKENKPIFIDFYTTWCLPCKLMDEDVFMDKRLGKYMNKNFINLKLNAEEGHGRELAAIMGVRAYPTLVFLNEKGQVLVRKEGAAYQEEMYRMGDEALLKFQTTGLGATNGF